MSAMAACRPAGAAPAVRHRGRRRIFVGERMSPKDTLARASEAQIQRAAVEWFNLALHANVAWCAIPNGGYRRRKEAQIMKGLGTIPGAPDLVVWYPPGRALCLEIKTDTGRISESQYFFHAKLEWCGVPIVVCRSLDDVIEAVRSQGVPMRGDADIARAA